MVAQTLSAHGCFQMRGCRSRKVQTWLTGLPLLMCHASIGAPNGVVGVRHGRLPRVGLT